MGIFFQCLGSPAQIGFQFPGTPSGPFHLAGMRIAALLGQKEFGVGVVVLAQRNVTLLGGINQFSSGAIIHPGIGGKANIFFLYGCVDVDLFSW